MGWTLKVSHIAAQGCGVLAATLGPGLKQPTTVGVAQSGVEPLQGSTGCENSHPG